MQKKDSYDFPVKARYRELWKEFLDHHLPKKKKVRKNVRVASLIGHEALEVTEVYDKLGIERHNITAIEANPISADEIEERRLGINVARMYADDFFFQTDNTFHVVNLDFQGPYGPSAARTLQMMVGRQVLHPWSIVGTNFLRKRERRGGDGYKRYLGMLNAVSSTRELFRHEDGHENIVEALGSEADALDDFSTKDIANGSINRAVREFLNMGRMGMEVSDSYRQLAEILSLEMPRFKEWVDKMDAAKTPQEYQKAMGALERIELHVIARNFSVAEQEAKGWESARAHVNFVMADSRDYGSYLVEDLFTGKYVSDKGSPMVFDFFKVHRPDRIVTDFPVTFGVRDGEYKSSLPSVHELGKRGDGTQFILDQEKRYKKFHPLQFLNRKRVPRIYIGSDATGELCFEEMNEDSATDLISKSRERSGTTDLEGRTRGNSDSYINAYDTVKKVDSQIIGHGPLTRLSFGNTCSDLPLRTTPGHDEMRGKSANSEVTTLTFEPMPLQYDISGKDDLYAALDLAEEVGDLPDKGRAKYVLDTFSVNPEYQSGLAAKIAHWTMSREKPVDKKEVPKQQIPPSTGSFTENPDNHYVAAVASRYGNSRAAKMFDVAVTSVPAMKAQVAMGRYPDYDAAIVEDAVFIADRRKRPLPELVMRLAREHGGVDNFPDEIMSHYGLERIE